MRARTSMKFILRILAGSIMLLILLPFGAFADQDLDWPRLIETEKGKILVYQPQLESFTGDRLDARAAVSVTLKGKEAPVFGAVWIKARVETDRNTRTITLLEIDVTNSRFPGATTRQLAELEKRLEWAIPRWTPTTSLDRILAMMDLVEKERASAESLKNDPPKIVLVDHPAVLVTLDGEPRLSKMETGNLMRVVNTPFFILLNQDDMNWYLKGGEAWLSAKEVMGPWETARNVPSVVKASVKEETGEKKPKEVSSGKMPRVIVAKVPTELIQTDGKPNYTPISGTELLFVSNTQSDLFLEIASQRHFVLISGRWYAARELSGDWSFVSPEELPDAFRKIPEGAPKGRVLSSVPGTSQAKEAVLDTHIPQTAAIKRNAATIAVTYDGPPRFVQIQGTPMLYAENSAYSVIKVENAYYACHQAVWYRADNPMGPWAVCVMVPEVIYTIPPSCPIYSVKYVHVYHHTPSVVYVGYTPGYVGCYVSHGVVVYGTGYLYRGWYGRVYYPRPVTWGAAVRYNPHTGNWAFAVGHRGYYGGWAAVGGRGAGAGAVYRGGWWGYGGYRGYGEREIDIDRSITTPRGTLTDSINIERDWDGDIDIDRNVNFEPNENIYKRAENREKLASSQGREKLSQKTRDTANRQPVSRTGERADQVKSSFSGASKRVNNVYTDRNGDVFKKTEQGWQKRNPEGWAKTTGTGRENNLNRDYRARERGTQRTRSFNSSRSASRGSMGRRGGGRRR